MIIIVINNNFVHFLLFAFANTFFFLLLHSLFLTDYVKLNKSSLNNNNNIYL